MKPPKLVDTAISKSLHRLVPASDLGRISLVFFLSHFFILFNKSIGWDGYALLNGSYDTIMKDFKTYGLSELLGIIHITLVNLSNSPVLVYNCAVLVTTFFATLLTFFILERLELFTKNDVVVITLLATVLPYTFISLIGITAIIFYDLFLLGILFLLIFLETKNILLRVIALLTFFLSFFYNSHVSFYLVALLVIGYKSSPPFRIRNYFTRFPDFTFLPVIYIFYQKISFALMDGVKVTDYNSFDVYSFLRLPKYLAYSLQQSFFRLFEMIFDMMSQMHSVIIVFLLCPVVYFLLRSRSLNFAESRIAIFKNWHLRKSYFFLVLGIFLFLLGAFPFSLVSKPPGFYSTGAADMHQINLYLGAALTIYSLVVIFFREKFQKLILIFLLSCFILSGFKNVLSFNKQWLKEEAILVNSTQNEAIRNNQTFLFEDHVKELNSSFTLQIFTLNSLLHRAFKDEQTRFAVTKEELGILMEKSFNLSSKLVELKVNPVFKMKDYSPENFDRKIFITPGDLKLTDPVTIKLLYYSFFNQTKFNQQVQRIISLVDLACNNCKQLVN